MMEYESYKLKKYNSLNRYKDNYFNKLNDLNKKVIPSDGDYEEEDEEDILSNFELI